MKFERSLENLPTGPTYDPMCSPTINAYFPEFLKTLQLLHLSWKPLFSSTCCPLNPSICIILSTFCSHAITLGGFSCFQLAGIPNLAALIRVGKIDPLYALTWPIFPCNNQSRGSASNSTSIITLLILITSFQYSFIFGQCQKI